MDVEMGDVAYDIDIDVGAGVESSSAPPPQTQAAQQPEQPTQGDSVPAAYFEDLQPQKPWPEYLNLQGVGDFDPNDPLYYAMETLGTEPRVKQLRWVNDHSVNLEFYSAQDAALALTALTHQDTNAASIAAQTPRPAKPYSKKPDSALTVREANVSDQKPKGAANRSNYYQRNPDVRDNKQREPRRRQPPQRDLLDYGDDEQGGRSRRRRSRSGDMSMDEDSGVERRRNNYPRNDRAGRDRRDRRDGQNGRPRDSGRLNADVDSYRPGGDGESRHGRLRGRSASPASGDEGDGRYGFAEDSTNVRTRYRSRSRSHTARRRRDPSAERWTHDRANYGEKGGKSDGRWQKDMYSADTSAMGNHRRSDAGSGGSLLSRMTKDGRPVNSLASRITRDDDDGSRPRSLASRITRDDNEGYSRSKRGDSEGYGRLKGDDSIPRDYEFDEPKPRRGLADRISRETEGINIRGQGANGGGGGINIRGVANAS